MVYEDIMKLNNKMLLVLFAELNKVDKLGLQESTNELIGKKLDY